MLVEKKLTLTNVDDTDTRKAVEVILICTDAIKNEQKVSHFAHISVVINTVSSVLLLINL